MKESSLQSGWVHLHGTPPRIDQFQTNAVKQSWLSHRALPPSRNLQQQHFLKRWWWLVSKPLLICHVRSTSCANLTPGIILTGVGGWEEIFQQSLGLLHLSPKWYRDPPCLPTFFAASLVLLKKHSNNLGSVIVPSHPPEICSSNIFSKGGDGLYPSSHF